MSNTVYDGICQWNSITSKLVIPFLKLILRQKMPIPLLFLGYYAIPLETYINQLLCRNIFLQRIPSLILHQINMLLSNNITNHFLYLLRLYKHPHLLTSIFNLRRTTPKTIRMFRYTTILVPALTHK